MIPSVASKSVNFEVKAPEENVSFDQKVYATVLEIFENEAFWLWSLKDMEKRREESYR